MDVQHSSSPCSLCALITAQIQALWLAWSSGLAFSLQSLHYENVRFLQLFLCNSSSYLGSGYDLFFHKVHLVGCFHFCGMPRTSHARYLKSECISCWNLTPRLFICLSFPPLLLRVGFDKQKDTAAVITAPWGCLGHCGNTVISQSVLEEQNLKSKDEGALSVAHGFCCDLSFQVLTRFPHLLMLRPAH